MSRCDLQAGRARRDSLDDKVDELVLQECLGDVVGNEERDVVALEVVDDMATTCQEREGEDGHHALFARANALSQVQPDAQAWASSEG